MRKTPAEAGVFIVAWRYHSATGQILTPRYLVALATIVK